uniref:Uncharacterized protein n=1 Tax=Vespula pensylvanica TaxID=30213 RepID=A0A834U4S9_VESPE|nr:hypothetical protein H0235_011099 [Vespula pensylvanica]
MSPNKWQESIASNQDLIDAKEVAEEYHEFQVEEENLQEISSGQGNIRPFNIHEKHVRMIVQRKQNN